MLTRSHIMLLQTAHALEVFDINGSLISVFFGLETYSRNLLHRFLEQEPLMIPIELKLIKVELVA